jgi:alkylglycerol monooxygenase
LIIWDIIFGTFALERTPPNEKADIEPVAFGLTHPINTFDPLTVQFHHLKHVLRNIWSTPGLTNKFKVLFYGPGWHVGTPRTGLLEEIPPIAKDVPPQKYDPSLSIGINTYVVLHFAVLIVVNGILLGYQTGELNFAIVLTICSYIFYTLTAFGWIFDHKTWAIEGEFLRSLFVCGAIEVAKQNNLLPKEAVYFQAFQLLSGLWLLAAHISTLKQKKQVKAE